MIVSSMAADRPANERRPLVPFADVSATQTAGAKELRTDRRSHRTGALLEAS